MENFWMGASARGGGKESGKRRSSRAHRSSLAGRPKGKLRGLGKLGKAET